MLREIYCDKFYQKRIVFNPGLSVVLGTNTGDNSIGKSTFLLIVDYVFGGSTYANTADIIENVGSHDIYFTFVFGEEPFKFCRNSIKAHSVWKCNDSYEKVRFLYKGIIINHNKKPSQPTLKRRFFQEKGGVFFMARFWKGVVLT